MKSNLNVGIGCTTRIGGVPVHNPAPSTERGKRRHAAKDAQAKKVAEKAWSTDRSMQKSKYQTELETHIRPTTKGRRDE